MFDNFLTRYFRVSTFVVYVHVFFDRDASAVFGVFSLFLLVVCAF